MPPFSFSFDVQSCCAYSFRHLESPSFLIFCVQSHFSSALSCRVITSGIHNSLALHILLSRFYISSHFPHLVTLCLSLVHLVTFEFTTHISVVLLGTLHLAFSCSSHRVVPFGHIISYTPRWFNYYSSLTLIFESLLEKS